MLNSNSNIKILNQILQAGYPERSQTGAVLRGRPAFLAGSGISIDPPSNLPSGFQFTKKILENILPSNQINDILKYTDDNAFSEKGEESFLRFEQLMSIIKEDLDPNLNILDIYSKCERPNFNHFFLAKAILLGFPVLTTNFDSLIEYALMKLGINRKDINSVIEKEDWEKFGEFGWIGDNLKGPPYLVYKLHGSMKDIINNKDTRSSIQATLEQIASEKSGAALTLEPWKLKIFKNCIKLGNLVVIGYSGLDDFDIIPSLKRMDLGRRIVWISHSPSNDFNNASIKSNLVNISSFDKSNRLEKLLHDLTSLYGVISLIKIDTRKLLEYIKKLFFIEDLDTHFEIEIGVNFNSSQLNLKNFNLNEGFKNGLAGRIWRSLGKLNKALEVIKNALDYFDKKGNIKDKSKQLTQLGIVYNDLGESEISLRCHKQALNIDKKLNILHWVASDYNNIGKIFYEKKQFSEALDYYERGLKIARKIKDLRTTSAMLTNIGNVLSDSKKNKKAMEFYEQALDCINIMGDLYAKFSLLTNIGSLHVEIEEYEKATAYYKEAKAIAKHLGDNRSYLLICEAQRDKLGGNTQGEISEILRFGINTLRAENAHYSLDIPFLKIHNKDPIFSNKNEK